MESFAFKGNGFEYFKIWIVNILLIIITFSLYYPWAKVRNRRYFYGNSWFTDRNFEYHATGKQLFIGYLISLFVLLLFIFSQSISPYVAVGLAIAFPIAIPWLIWSGLRFNLRMTSFSNVRFGFAGSLAGAYMAYLLVPIAVVIGLVALVVGYSFVSQAVPASAVGIVLNILFMLAIGIGFIAGFSLIAKVANTYHISGCRYGQTAFSTQLSKSQFTLISLKTIGITLLLMFGFFVLLAVIVAASGLVNSAIDSFATGDQELIQQSIVELMVMPGVVALIMAMYLGFILLGTAISAYQMCLIRNYIYSRTVLNDDIHLSSSLKVLPLTALLVTNFLLLIFTFGLAMPWVAVRTHRYMLENTQLDFDGEFDQFISQQEAHTSSLGEQIGDAFDVGVDVAF